MTTRGIRSGAISAVLALMLAGSACGSDDGDGGGGDSGTDSGLAIAAQDFQFSPSSLTVPSGESTITVTNEGEVEHSFTLDDDSVSEDVEPGESISVTVDISKDAGFHCEYHPDQMTGTLSVS
jgi:plastocyanin